MIQTPDYPEYADLRAAAELSVRADGGFVDPAKLGREQNLGRGHDWRISVLGHSSRTTLVELHMLLIADERGIEPPLPEWLAAHRAERQAKRDAEQAAYAAQIAALEAEWAALWKALPVPVTVAYNYSGPNHYETWTQGAVHILVSEDLNVGRLHRPKRSALCSVPSNRGHQDFAHDISDNDRCPSCKACIRTACRLTGLEAPTLLTQRR